MSQHIKQATATLAAAACLAFATGVGAAGTNDDQTFVDSPTAVCHPAYRPCRKEAPQLAMTLTASVDTPYVVAADEFNHEMAGSVCHPAYRPCANWTLWVVTSK